MLTTDTELESLFKSWSDCTLPGKSFTHAAHLAVCTHLTWNHTLAESYSLMKTGIHRFNEAGGTPNTEDRGYHETLTRFWCTLLFFKVHRGHFPTCIAAVEAMQTEFGKDSRAERVYYSFDVLKSREARKRWIAPDVSGKDVDGLLAHECFCW